MEAPLLFRSIGENVSQKVTLQQSRMTRGSKLGKYPKKSIGGGQCKGPEAGEFKEQQVPEGV